MRFGECECEWVNNELLHWRGHIHMENFERQKWNNMTSCRSPFSPGSTVVENDQDGGYNVLGELIFHYLHQTNCGSELGMSKSMTKSKLSCVCVWIITYYDAWAEIEVV